MAPDHWSFGTSSCVSDVHPDAPIWAQWRPRGRRRSVAASVTLVVEAAPPVSDLYFGDLRRNRGSGFWGNPDRRCTRAGDRDVRDRLRLLQGQDALTKGGIRPTEEDELVGLDLPEMGVLAYPDFLGHGGVPSTGWRSGPGPGAGRGRLSRGNHVNDTSEGPALSGASFFGVVGPPSGAGVV
jgi:hypothetical protein